MTRKTLKKILLFGLSLGVIWNGFLAGFGGIFNFAGFFGVFEGAGMVYAETVESDETDDENDDNEDGNGDEDEDEDNEAAWEPPELYIRSINPGYGSKNSGEMIEIARGKDSDTLISLAGTALGYTKTSGEPTITLVEFPENSWMTGETILLRLASSPERELANMTYKITGSSSGLTQKSGPLVLIRDGEEVDEVCWTGEKGCERGFKSGSGESLVRDLETGEWEFKEYTPEYQAENYRVEEEKEEGEGSESVTMAQCKGLQFSEILSYYEVEKSEQFIEFYNSGTGAVELNGCKIRYKNKNYVLAGKVEADGYFVYYPVGFSLTKNPTNSNKIELIDADDTVVDTLVYPNGQRKGTSYAWLGYDADGEKLWRVTYAPTPGTANNYQEFKTCTEGKVINKVTGNCVKVTSVKNKVCKDGQYLNLLTGRCKKITTTAEKTCKEGYHLNLETNRCRKIKENNGANYSLEPENYNESSSFVALYAVLGVLGVGGLYLIYEFRDEIKKFFGKVFRRSR